VLRFSPVPVASVLLAATWAVAFCKLGWLSERAALGTVAGVAAAGLAACGFVYGRRLAPLAGALLLDRAYASGGRLSSAVAFAQLPERDAWQESALADGISFARTVEPARAAPLRAPPHGRLQLGLCAFLVLVAVVRVRPPAAPPAAPLLEALEWNEDDAEAVRSELAQLEAKLKTDEAKQATHAFNELLLDLGAKRLDREEAFRRLHALEQRLLEGERGDQKALEEALAKLGEALKKSELTKPTGEALAQADLPSSEKALRDLAKRLREGPKPDAAQLEAMREALRQAAASADARAEALEKRREEAAQSLLREKQRAGDGGRSEAQESLLKKKERELERLEREAREAQSGARELDRLDRELQQAAEDLAKDLGLSAEDLDRGAEDLNRMAEQQMSLEEKEQLRQKLQELREMLRRQGQGGAGQKMRLRKFQQAARGGAGGGGRNPQPGDDGEEGEGRGSRGQGQRGQGQSGQGQSGQGSGSRGQGSKGQGEEWVLGPNGERLLLMPAQRQGQGSGQGDGEGAGQGGQGGEGKGQRGQGRGHDDNVKGAATKGIGQTSDTQVAGQDTGQGQSRSEVIETAAQRGFVSRGYEKVFREYETVAEEALAKDEVPGGYRFYVRRYFQLIRPRDEEKTQ
jgi:hypothetical protein